MIQKHYKEICEHSTLTEQWSKNILKKLILIRFIMIWKRVRWSYWFFGKERNFYDKYINGKFLGQWSENVIKKIREHGT